MSALLLAQSKHVDNSPFWAGEGIGLVFAGIFVVFAVYVIVQRVRASRRQKGSHR